MFAYQTGIHDGRGFCSFTARPEQPKYFIKIINKFLHAPSLAGDLSNTGLNNRGEI